MNLTLTPAPSGGSAPSDKRGAMYIIIFILGTGTLVPWNIFISAVDYFGEVYQGDHMDRKMTVCYLPAMVAAMLVMLRWNDLLSNRTRAFVGFVGFSVLLLTVPVVDAVLVKGHSAPPIAQFLTLCAVFWAGIFDGMAQGAILGDAAYLPKRYQQGYAAGTAGAGVIVSLLRIATKCLFPDSFEGLRWSTILYFCIGTTFTAICALLAAYAAPKLSIFKFYRGQEDHKSPHVKTVEAEEDERAQLMESSTAGRESCLYVALKVKHVLLGLLVIYTVTLTIFPGVLAEDITASKKSGYWYNVLLVLAFNLADLVGKILPAFTNTIEDQLRLLWWCVVRLLFLPIFFVVVKFWPGSHPVVMTFLILALGTTNGFLTTHAFILGPRLLEKDEKAQAGNLLVLALAIGLVIGALGGWLWVWISFHV